MEQVERGSHVRLFQREVLAIVCLKERVALFARSLALSIQELMQPAAVARQFGNVARLGIKHEVAACAIVHAGEGFCVSKVAREGGAATVPVNRERHRCCGLRIARHGYLPRHLPEVFSGEIILAECGVRIAETNEICGGIAVEAACQRWHVDGNGEVLARFYEYLEVRKSRPDVGIERIAGIEGNDLCVAVGRGGAVGYDSIKRVALRVRTKGVEGEVDAVQGLFRKVAQKFDEDAAALHFAVVRAERGGRGRLGRKG